jgi:threonyl-tRNA synthetase
LRADVDDGKERMNAKIRKAQGEKIPYMLIAGDRDVESGAVSVRLRSGEDLGGMPVETFIAKARLINESRSQRLMPESD